MGHTKSELLSSRVAKGASLHQPHPKTGMVENHPGMKDTTANSRDMEHAQSQSGNIARSGGKPKHNSMAAVPLHGGMTTQTKQGFAACGGDMKSAVDADPANPITKEPQGKRLTPVKLHPFMSRANCVAVKTSADHLALGAAVLAQGRLAVRGK